MTLSTIQFIKINRHLSAVHLQAEIIRQYNLVMPIGLIKDQLATQRAEAHSAGAVTPR